MFVLVFFVCYYQSYACCKQQFHMRHFREEKKKIFPGMVLFSLLIIIDILYDFFYILYV